MWDQACNLKALEALGKMSWNARKRTRKDNDPTTLSDGLSDEVTRENLKSFYPRMNRFEHAGSNTVTVTIELPGLKSEDVAVHFLHDKLTISGQSPDQRPGEGTFTTRELPYGKFSRTLKVPLGIKPGDFKARMENGLLTLTFPKDPTKQEPYRIHVE